MLYTTLEYTYTCAGTDQERQAGAAVNVADIKLEQDGHGLVADVAHGHLKLRACGEEGKVNAAPSAPPKTHEEAVWQSVATHPAIHLAARRNDADLRELAQEAICRVH